MIKQLNMVSEDEIKYWKKRLYNSLKDLADIEFQRLAWAGKHPTLISSFTEVLCTLYDDLEFKSFIKLSENTHNEGNFYNLLVALDVAITEYKNYGYSVEQERKGYQVILSDPRWIKITCLANDIVIKYSMMF